jgi:hypothetical protein
VHLGLPCDLGKSYTCMFMFIYMYGVLSFLNVLFWGRPFLPPPSCPHTLRPACCRCWQCVSGLWAVARWTFRAVAVVVKLLLVG